MSGTSQELMLLFAKWRDEGAAIGLMLGQPGSACISARQLRVTRVEPGIVQLDSETVSVLVPIVRVTWGYVEAKDLPPGTFDEESNITACVEASLSAGERAWFYVAEEEKIE